MTEKEFLITFMKFCKDKTNEDLDVPEKDRVDIDEKLADKYINCFFEEHHKEYYEVEFVKKQETFYGIPYFLDNECIDKDKAYLVRDGKILGRITDFDIKPEEEPVTFKGVTIEFDKSEEIANTESIEIKRVSPIELTAEEAETMLKVYKEQMEKFTKDIK